MTRFPLSLFLAAMTMTWSCARPHSDERQRHSSPPVPETVPSSPETLVERGARGARPETPAPPVPSVEGGELPPPALPDTRPEALRAVRARLGRLERRLAALEHPFATPPEVEPHPVFDHRAQARRDVERLAQSSDEDWELAYVAAWRSLDDFHLSMRRVAREEGLRPARVKTQPDTVVPPRGE